MAELSKDIQEGMNNVAFRYAHELRINIQRTLNKPEFKSSGRLANSVHVTLKEATEFEPPVIRIEFEEYGEYIGKRKLLWTKMPSVKKLTEWVERKGFDDSSSSVPGYTNGAPKLPAYKRAERIAWAIAMKKRNDNLFNRRPWKKEALPSVLRQMNSETTTRWAGIFERLFAKSLSTI